MEEVLACLRQVAWPCAPPMGVGEFELLYVNAAEVVVWYTPAREGQRTGEVAIPCARIAAAWQRLRAGASLDEANMSEVCGGLGMGRWVLALLALVPGMSVRQEPLSLSWSPLPAPDHGAPVGDGVPDAKARARRPKAAGG